MLRLCQNESGGETLYLAVIDLKKIWLVIGAGVLVPALRADPSLPTPVTPCPSFSKVLPQPSGRAFISDERTRPNRGDLAFVYVEGPQGETQYQEAIVGRFLPRDAGEPVISGHYQVYIRDSSGNFTRKVTVPYTDFSTRNQRLMGNLHPHDRRFPDALAPRAEAKAADGSTFAYSRDPNFELATGRETMHLAPIQGGGPMGFTLGPSARPLVQGASGAPSGTIKRGDIVLVPVSKVDPLYEKSRAYVPVKVEGFSMSADGEVTAVVCDPRMENAVYPKTVSVRNISATPERLASTLDKQLKEVPPSIDRQFLPSPYFEIRSVDNAAFRAQVVEWARQNGSGAQEFLSALARSNSVTNRNMARLWRTDFINAGLPGF